MRHIHPDLRFAARIMPASPVTPRTLPFVRAAIRLLDLRARRRPGVEVLTLPSGIGVRLHRPPETARPGPALLWIHGGGYVVGSAASEDAVCRRFADELGTTVASVDYRLAPEHPFPAPLEDCYEALTWLAELPAVDPARIAIGGASAGGGLAAGLAFLARDRGEVDVVAQLLVYPMIDDRSGHTEDPTGGPTGVPHRLWSRASNSWGWSSYLGDADPNVAAPARRRDLAGLPPAWIGVGTADLFHGEDVAYAEELRRAGVPCDLEVVPGAFHGFDGIVANAPVSQRFAAAQVDFLRPFLRVVDDDAADDGGADQCRVEFG